jgi:hypothetical protein
MEWPIGSFGKLRLDKTGAILGRMMSHKTVCLPGCGADHRDELRFGRFCAGPRGTVAGRSLLLGAC